MQLCEKCHVQIRGNKAVCPLCEGELTGTPENPAFPALKKRKHTARWVMKVALFVLIALEIVMGTLRYLLGPSAAWCSVIILWAPLGLLGILITMAYRYNVLILISVEAFVAMVLNLMIDSATGGHGWAIEFVVPALFIAMVGGVFMVSLILKRKPDEYLVYLVSDEVISFLQIIFVLNGKNGHPEFAVSVMAFMLILIFAELIFAFQEFRNATVKTFHM